MGRCIMKRHVGRGPFPLINEVNRGFVMERLVLYEASHRPHAAPLDTGESGFRIRTVYDQAEFSDHGALIGSN
jgi:hypothetical protein